jgi:hypothetical protein
VIFKTKANLSFSSTVVDPLMATFTFADLNLSLRGLLKRQTMSALKEMLLKV